MYEKESKLSQAAPILDNNRTLLIEILMMHHFSFKHLFLMGVLENID